MSKTILAAAVILVGITNSASAAIDPAHVANPSLGRTIAPVANKTVAWLLPVEQITDNRVIVENRSGDSEDNVPGSGVEDR